MIDEKNFQVLVLCKKKTFYSSMLIKFFEKYNIACKMVLDYPVENRMENNIVCYDDKDLLSRGFSGLSPLAHRNRIKIPGAWEKSFFYLDKQLNYDYYYFIEDDVFSNDLQVFIKLFEKLKRYNTDLVSTYIESRNSYKDWIWWKEFFFFSPEKQYKSFNCICRLSKELVKKILLFQSDHNKFMFQEALFASVCVNSNLSYIDLKRESDYSDYFEDYDYISKSIVNHNKITHAIKQY